MRISTKIAAIFFVFFITTSFQTHELNHNSTEPSYALKTVVIDAGHGGHDHGCSGAKSKEKNVALSISLKLGAFIESNFPNVKVIYTRKTDIFIELHERAAIANRNNADLFICIHCNANPSTSPFGTETYVMGLHKTDANLGVAKRENDVILMEDNYTQHYDGFDPSNPASHIIFSLYQHAYMNQSVLFAGKCEQEFKKINRHSRGVKQAGFLVLWKTAMPSVLIETGFLTNTKDENFLASESGQIEMAESIFSAFKSYKLEMENTSGNGNETEISKISTQMNEEKEEIEGNDEEKKELEYYVQFYAAESNISATNNKFKALQKEKIQSVKENGWYKYRIGPYKTIELAFEKQTFARKQGFQDAFVLAIKDGKRVSIEEAKLQQTH